MIGFFYSGELAAILAAILWSVAVILFRSLSKNISPFLIAALKNSIALLLFIILFLYLSIPFWHSQFLLSDYLKIIISGCLGMGFADVLFIYTLSMVGANRAAIVGTFEPVVIYITSFFMLGTLLTFQQNIGLLIAISGLLIIIYEKDFIDINPQTKKIGLLLQLSAMCFASFGIVLIKPLLNQIQSDISLQLWVTLLRLIPGFIISWVVFLIQKNRILLLAPLRNSRVLQKVFLSSSVGTFMALSFWIIGYSKLEPPVASMLGQTSVIFILILSVLFLKERITRTRVLSALVVIFGVALVILT